MMRSAVIGGTGFYKMMDGEFAQEDIDTPYGIARVHIGTGEYEDLVFLARHAVDHSIPPHKINYRANIKALDQLGVKTILATFTVGSLTRDVPPNGFAMLDQFMDFTSGRDGTFYEGGDSGLAHVEVNQPYCDSLREMLTDHAEQHGVNPRTTATYVCTNGPRFETPAEVAMYAQMGGHVVGMTGVPEVVLARECGMHYAAVAHSINWGAGLEKKIEIVREGVEQARRQLLSLYVDVLRQPFIASCECETALMLMHPPKNDGT